MYRHTRNYENFEKAFFNGCGEYGIPIIEKTDFKSHNFIPFNFAMTEKQKENKSVHFFIDDYQFERIWKNPDRYIPILKKFNQVMSPDFSTYTDYPKALQIYNHYRKHWLGAYMQMNGIDVIPTISWSDKDSFEWCFDGEPDNGTVAISSVGCMDNENSKKLFIDGYNEMIKRLKPKTIIFYGKVPKQCEGNIVKIKSFQEKFNGGKK